MEEGLHGDGTRAHARRGPARIQEGSMVTLSHNGGERYTFVSVKRGGYIRVGKVHSVSIEPLIGAKYGSIFEFDPEKGVLECCSISRSLEELFASTASKAATPEEEGKTNQSLYDTNSSQQLSMSDVHMLKRARRGDEVVRELAHHSESYEQKTAFSQEKWMQRKLRRHATFISPLYPSMQNIAEASFAKTPRRIGFLRPDALSHLLHFANVGPRARVLVVDGCGGIVTGAVAERLQGKGKVATCINPTGKQKFEIINRFALSSSALGGIVGVHFSHLSRGQSYGEGKAAQTDAEGESNNENESSESETDARPDGSKQCALSKAFPFRVAGGEEAASLTREEGFTGLIIANVGGEPLAALERALEHLLPGTPFSLWHPTLEPLAEARARLGSSEMVANVHLQEPWHRPYQVLPQRTHPYMTIDSAGGYLLTGTFLRRE